MDNICPECENIYIHQETECPYCHTVLREVAGSAFRVEHRDLALAGLKKRDLIRLLTLAGMPPQKTEDRRRELMALRLSRLVDKMTITIEWDSRMPSAN